MTILDTVDYESSALEAFGPIPIKLSIPLRDDSEMVDWAMDHLFKDVLLYNNAFGWLRWDGKRWVEVQQVLIVEYIRLAVQSLRKKAKKKGLPKETQDALARLASKSKLKSVTEFAQGRCFKSAEEFDAKPNLITLQNGEFNFITGELGPFDRSNLMTKIAGASYIEGYRHEDVDKALSCLDPEEIDWLQICFGQGLTGFPNPADHLILLKGGGSNGKSAILDGVLKSAGDYGVFLPEKTLMASKSDHSTEKMPLKGARIAVLEELPDGAVLPVKRLKDIVGTPQITARGINKDNVTWDASHTLFISTNYLPIVDESDTGTWRRLKLLLFNKRFVDASELVSPNDMVKDATLKQRIADGEDGQHDAMMTWMIEGAMRFYENGKNITKEPKRVVDATLEWRRDSDVLFEFFESRIERSASNHIFLDDLSIAFNDFMSINARPNWSKNLLKKRISSHEELRVSRDGFTRFRNTDKGIDRLKTPLSQPLPSQYTALSGYKFKETKDF